MKYSYVCLSCESTKEVQASIKVGPPRSVDCNECKKPMQRDWQTDLPEMNTSECRDHADIPFHKRVCDARLHPFGVGKAKAQKIEAAYAAVHQKKRRMKRETGSKKMVMEASYPAELYHGKIRETGDKHYWDSPKNRKRHKEWNV